MAVTVLDAAPNLGSLYAKAAVTGKSPDPGENETVQL